MKLTKPSVLELRSLSPVFCGPGGGAGEHEPRRKSAMRHGECREDLGVSRRQRTVLWLEAAVLLAMLAAPPYFGIDRASEGRVHAHLGYFALWSPPSSMEVCRALGALPDCENRPEAFEAGLNKVRLFVNVAASLVAAAACFHLSRDKTAG